MNFDIGAASPINRAVLSLLNKAEAGKHTDRLGEKPGKDVLGEHNLDPERKKQEAKEKRTLLKTFAARPVGRKVD